MMYFLKCFHYIVRIIKKYEIKKYENIGKIFPLKISI